MTRSRKNVKTPESPKKRRKQSLGLLIAKCILLPILAYSYVFLCGLIFDSWLGWFFMTNFIFYSWVVLMVLAVLADIFFIVRFIRHKRKGV